ncbi:uncharacterized protein LOC127833875 isoform X2 [Dreissena polymorpha]|uniref:uncharacterized protein LOC127833875 isoform X2 n=1 Tax=Dreissena polymorpha TaxID=45954 RepID=UPI002263AC91|nr:uncharacterized protein LOC127833875 isoform X2 [Dreissena polymorpha]
METKAAEQKQLQSVEETEADSIGTSHALDKIVTPDPKCISVIHVDSASTASTSAHCGIVVESTVEPDQKTTILISHVNQTDTHAGEYFGATLYTYKRSPGEQFEYQHLLKNIKDGYPAQTMKICEGDELVLIGYKFTPELEHTEVLNNFLHHVIVDGKSRFCLVLKSSGHEFWYETCAILTPNHDVPDHDLPPKVTNPKFGPAKSIILLPKKIIFSIQGSMEYMFIDKTGIQGVPMTQPRLYVNMTRKLSFNPWKFTAALSGMDGQSYVHIDGQRNIVISDKSNRTFFGYTKIGDDYRFYVDVFFLSYDKISKSFAMSNINTDDNIIIYEDVGTPSCPSSDNLEIDSSMMAGNSKEGVNMRRVPCCFM